MRIYLDSKNSNQSKMNNENLIRITLKCNMNCLFCNVQDKQEPVLTKLKTINHILSLSNQKNITFTGGEPTLDKNLINYIKLARRNKIKNIILQTNGLMLSYPEYTSLLKNAGLTKVFLPFHSADPDKFDSLAQLKGSYKKVIEAIKNIIDSNLALELNIVINSLNYLGLLDTVKFIEKEFPTLLKSKQLFSFSFIQPHGKARKNKELIPRLSEIKLYLNKAMKYCKKNNIRFINPGCGVPPCIIPEFAKYSAELNRRISEIVHNEKDKIKSPNCKDCMYCVLCLGVWKEYANIYGLSELIPIIKGTKIKYA